jgi:hypothetical protein
MNTRGRSRSTSERDKTQDSRRCSGLDAVPKKEPTVARWICDHDGFATCISDNTPVSERTPSYVAYCKPPLYKTFTIPAMTDVAMLIARSCIAGRHIKS